MKEEEPDRKTSNPKHPGQNSRRNSLWSERGRRARKGDFLISYVGKGIRPPRKKEGFPEDVKST